MSSSPRPKHLCRCRHLILNPGDGVCLLSFSDGMRTLASDPSGSVHHYDMAWDLVASSTVQDLSEILDDMVRSCLAQEVLWS